MIKPVKNSKPFCPDNGDILYGPEYVLKEVKVDDAKHMDRLPVCLYNNRNPWVSLPKRFGIDANELKKAVEYICPYIENKYYWILPTYLILIKNKVENYNGEPDDFGFDINWWKRNALEPTTIDLAFLGHGYTECNLPYDGKGYNS